MYSDKYVKIVYNLPTTAKRMFDELAPFAFTLNACPDTMKEISQLYSKSTELFLPKQNKTRLVTTTLQKEQAASTSYSRTSSCSEAFPDEAYDIEVSCKFYGSNGLISIVNKILGPEGKRFEFDFNWFFKDTLRLISQDILKHNKLPKLAEEDKNFDELVKKSSFDDVSEVSEIVKLYGIEKMGYFFTLGNLSLVYDRKNNLKFIMDLFDNACFLDKRNFAASRFIELFRDLSCEEIVLLEIEHLIKPIRKLIDYLALNKHCKLQTGLKVITKAMSKEEIVIEPNNFLELNEYSIRKQVLPRRLQTSITRVLLSRNSSITSKISKNSTENKKIRRLTNKESPYFMTDNQSQGTITTFNNQILYGPTQLIKKMQNDIVYNNEANTLVKSMTELNELDCRVKSPGSIMFQFASTVYTILRKYNRFFEIFDQTARNTKLTKIISKIEAEQLKDLKEQIAVIF